MELLDRKITVKDLKKMMTVKDDQFDNSIEQYFAVMKIGIRKKFKSFTYSGKRPQTLSNDTQESYLEKTLTFKIAGEGEIDLASSSSSGSSASNKSASPLGNDSIEEDSMEDMVSPCIPYR